MNLNTCFKEPGDELIRGKMTQMCVGKSLLSGHSEKLTWHYFWMTTYLWDGRFPAGSVSKCWVVHVHGQVVIELVGHQAPFQNVVIVVGSTLETKDVRKLLYPNFEIKCMYVTRVYYLISVRCPLFKSSKSNAIQYAITLAHNPEFISLSNQRLLSNSRLGTWKCISWSALLLSHGQ